MTEKRLKFEAPSKDEVVNLLSYYFNLIKKEKYVDIKGFLTFKKFLERHEIEKLKYASVIDIFVGFASAKILVSKLSYGDEKYYLIFIIYYNEKIEAKTFFVYVN